MVTMLLGVLLIAVIGILAELSVQVSYAAAVKVGIESAGLNLTTSGATSLPPVISLMAFMSGSPSSLSGRLAMDPVSTSTVHQLYSCMSSVTGSESRTVDTTIILTEQHACLAGFQDLTATVTAYPTTGQITVKLFSAAGLMATYTGSGTITMTFGCDLLSNHTSKVKAPGL